MDGHDQHVLRPAEAQQRRAQGRPVLEVEAGRRQLQDGAQPLGLAGRRDGQAAEIDQGQRRRHQIRLGHRQYF
jgi:hypothetical protein